MSNRDKIYIGIETDLVEPAPVIIRALSSHFNSSTSNLACLGSVVTLVMSMQQSGYDHNSLEISDSEISHEDTSDLGVGLTTVSTSESSSTSKSPLENNQNIWR